MSFRFAFVPISFLFLFLPPFFPMISYPKPMGFIVFGTRVIELGVPCPPFTLDRTYPASDGT